MKSKRNGVEGLCWTGPCEGLTSAQKLDGGCPICVCAVEEAAYRGLDAIQAFGCRHVVLT